MKNYLYYSIQGNSNQWPTRGKKHQVNFFAVKINFDS